jgi:hypothetical protein
MAYYCEACRVTHLLLARTELMLCKCDYCGITHLCNNSDSSETQPINYCDIVFKSDAAPADRTVHSSSVCKRKTKGVDVSPVKDGTNACGVVVRKRKHRAGKKHAAKRARKMGGINKERV